MTSQLPRELILEIFWNLSLKDCRSFLKATECDKKSKRLNPGNVTCALERRESPILYLSRFFPNSSELLTRMRMYNVWIVGSFALNYFSDHIQSGISEITFFIPFDLTMIINFMEYMRIMGVEWLPSPNHFASMTGTFRYHGSELSIKLVTIQSGLRDMIDCINTRDLSILQCAITGYSVFHMYANDVYDKQSSIWAYEHDGTFTYMPSQELVEKYRDIGYKFTQGSRYLPKDETLKQKKVSRTIGGVGSEFATFRQLGDWRSEPAKDEKKALEKYRWTEYPSFLRQSSDEYDYKDRQLFILRNQSRKYFNELRDSSDNEFMNTFESDYEMFERSMLDIGKLSVKDEYVYDSIDQSHYDQIGVICYLQGH
jgi:hypothetical protein